MSNENPMIKSLISIFSVPGPKFCEDLMINQMLHTVLSFPLRYANLNN